MKLSQGLIMSWIVKNKITGETFELFDKKNYEIAVSKPEKYEVTPIL